MDEEKVVGLRFNQGKPMFELIEPGFMGLVAEVLTVGASKYTPDNWKHFTAKQQKEIYGSLYRHLEAYRGGEIHDPETGISHIGHAACNLMFLYYFEKEKLKNSDK